MTRALLLVTVLATLGSFVGVSGAAASARLPGASGTPPVPSSTVSATSDPRTVQYCVQNYNFNSHVAVTNNTNGATGGIDTDAKGSGCTNMPVQTDCSQNVSNTIVAKGNDQAGKPASSQATYTAPPDSSQCGSPSPSPSTAPGGGTPTPSPSPTTCDSSQATLTVDVVPQGGTIHASGCGFSSGESVDAYAHSNPVYLGTVTASSKGNVAGSFTLPQSIKPGSHTFEFVGRSSGNVASAPFTVTSVKVGSGGGTIGNGSGGSGSGSSGSGGGGLAFTGADIAAMVLAALVLLAIGALLLVTVRRRR
ncbi:MAG: hypothetical protein ACTHK4_11175, partial [Mycobacteriales bacterium]